MGSLNGAFSSQRVMEEFKGQLSPDGNRAGRVKAQAGLTARLTSRAGAKAELSDPTVLYRKAGDNG
ncbi:MAG: hypothetical protein Athens071426_375 [Parcubacteria group bacterium Athens0714_26]|nr:MAG: hypothetical protein Athens101426_530 [Parcubacteria group bacterium Athens1014_26]TSD02863.1 MAG: hypothetical protein Athens071426_375 [Parcubacteria group bacterium Athens0714_26]